MTDANRPHCDRCGELVRLDRFGEWISNDELRTCPTLASDCEHCRNEPPKGHICPSCKRTVHTVDPWA